MFPTTTVLRGLELLQKDAREDSATQRAELNRQIDLLEELRTDANQLYAEYLYWAQSFAEAGKPFSIGQDYHQSTDSELLERAAELLRRYRHITGTRFYRTTHLVNLWSHVANELDRLQKQLESLSEDDSEVRQANAVLLAYEGKTISPNAAKQLGLNGRLLARAVARAS